MKKILSAVMMFVFSVAMYAQKDVTKFLGVPVDGSKAAMIRKLKAKGFTDDPYDEEALRGEFNGEDVKIYVVTNNNKVYRVCVRDIYAQDESNIKIRYNNLCNQFQNNKKYYSPKDYTLSDDEDISHGILTDKKRYDAYYCQVSSNAGTALSAEDMVMRIVWFMIGEENGRYRILMYYDNRYNQANGEDL